MSSKYVWPLILVALIIFILMKQSLPERQETDVSYSQFLKDISLKESCPYAEVIVDPAKYTAEGRYRGDQSRRYRVNLPHDPKLPEQLYGLNTEVPIVIKTSRMPDAWIQTALGALLPLGIFFFLYLMLMRQMQSGSGQALSFGKSRAKRFTDTFEHVTFDDVAGVEEAQEEVQEIVEYLKEPERFRSLGARIPRGVLLQGPPGCGKTLLARAIAGEANVPFYYISGSDFVEMFVGVGASRVRDLFEQAKRNQPCIIFIDEIDAVGRHRGSGLGGGHDEREQTLNQLLVEMDGFDKNSGVILLAASNRPDVLDPALLRPGRFDRRIVIDTPDLNGRQAIFAIYLRDRPISDDVKVTSLARRTPGFTGADIEILVNEAALLAARRNKKQVDMGDFEDATDRVQVGLERKSRVLSEADRRALAYHESGHALVGLMLPGSDPIHKVSITSRGQALGFTLQVPEEDRHMYSREQLLGRITATLGGRAAEELALGDVYSGAMDDLEKVAHIARAMVCTFGMSEKIGPVAFGHGDRQIFLGRDLIEERQVSEETATLIDQEIRSMVEECFQQARDILHEHRAALDEIVKILMEQETITGDELRGIVDSVEKGESRAAPASREEPSEVEASPAALSVGEAS